MIKTIRTLVCIIAICASSSAAELSKADATKLLTFMGHKNIVVAVVVNGIGSIGMGAFSSPNVALVIGNSERDGKPQEIQETFFYDRDLGWVYYVVQSNRVMVWTTSGYKEFKPGMSTSK